MDIQISSKIKSQIPDFKVGCITYHDIVIGDSPQMFQGRLKLFQESIMFDFDTKELTDFPGLKEWRSVFKKLGIDPSRYRPSSEALYRRLKKQEYIPYIHSAADLNNFFSLQYEIPSGIYDLETISGQITVDIGAEGDGYEGLNNRFINMGDKLLTRDKKGPFGSPITDSKRTAVTRDTTSAIQLLYLKPSMSVKEGKQLLQATEEMFSQIHGGTSESWVVS